MGTSILRGVTTGLLITVFTLLAVLGTTMAGVDKYIISYIIDFGLLLSCLAAGYKASRACGRILPAGLASGGYAVVGVLLLALYFPIEPVGALRIISEGTGLGLLAGVLGAGVLSSDPVSAVDRMEGGYYYPRREEPASFNDVIQDRQSTERARIYEICNKKLEKMEKLEEDDAFAWWEVERKRQLRGK